MTKQNEFNNFEVISCLFYITPIYVSGWENKVFEINKMPELKPEKSLKSVYVPPLFVSFFMPIQKQIQYDEIFDYNCL